MDNLCWLHISDWHQKDEDFDRKVVLEMLLEDIKNRSQKIDPYLEQVDFIVFSGDVSFQGKEQEYKNAYNTFLKPILEITSNDPNRIMIVPGNHDLNRKKFDLLPSDVRKTIEKSSKINEWLTDEERRSILLTPFKAYREFFSKFCNPNLSDFNSILKFNHGDYKIGIAGFNSAIMSGRNINTSGEVDDYGKLFVGEPQIYDSMNEISDCDLRIAVMHHSFDWLMPEDKYLIESRLMRCCHFVLCGHQHVPEIRVTRSNIGNCIVIPAGSCYDRRIPQSTRFLNSYNFVRLDLKNNQGVIFARCWNEKRNEWTNDFYFESQGKMTFDIPLKEYLRNLSKNNQMVKKISLEEKISKKFGVPKVLIVETNKENKIQEKLGEKAADFFLDHVTPNSVVGLSCGSTIYNMSLSLKKFDTLIYLYPISFNIGHNLSGVMASDATLFEIQRKNPRAIVYNIPIPAFFLNPDEEKRTCLHRADIKDLIENAYNPTIAFYSVGGLGPGSSYCRANEYIRKYVLHDFNCEDLKRKQACGEINWFPFTIEGEILNHQLIDHCASMPIKKIRELSKDPLRNMVLVAGGEQKFQPIVGALRGGFLNVLITDQSTAMKLTTF